MYQMSKLLMMDVRNWNFLIIFVISFRIHGGNMKYTLLYVIHSLVPNLIKLCQILVSSEKVKIKWYVDLHGNDIDIEIKINNSKYKTKLQKSPMVIGRYDPLIPSTCIFDGYLDKLKTPITVLGCPSSEKIEVNLCGFYQF